MKDSRDPFGGLGGKGGGGLQKSSILENQGSRLASGLGELHTVGIGRGLMCFSTATMKHHGQDRLQREPFIQASGSRRIKVLTIAVGKRGRRRGRAG